MAYQFNRFERFLLAGLVVTGLGLAVHYLSENVDGRADATQPDPTPDPAQETRTWYVGEEPPIDWFVDDYFVGVLDDGERVEGRVTGYPYGFREVKILDRRTGEDRVVPLAKCREWKIGRRPFDRQANQLYRFHLVRPGGREDVLEYYLLAESPRAFRVKGESGEMDLPKDAIRKIEPVKR